MSREAFEAMLDDDPSDVQTRLIYSDWLEEHGDLELAFAQRWLTQEGKWPDRERWRWCLVADRSRTDAERWLAKELWRAGT